MKIAVIGAAGKVGRHVVAEALRRDHEITAVVRQPRQASTSFEGATPATTRVGDAADAQVVAELAEEHDVVISAIRPTPGIAGTALGTTRALLEGASRAGTRLLIVGGAAGLVVPGTEGRLLMDDPRYLPPSARDIGEASHAQYRACLENDVADWTYLSPPAHLFEGPRTGRYRLGTDELLLDESGESSISMADLAVALLDEVAEGRHRRARFTAAY